MTDVTDPAEALTAKSTGPFLSTANLFSVAGALWAFFGLTVFSLLKDVILSERLSRLGGEECLLITAVSTFFLVNFLAILLFQGCGTALLLKDLKSPMPHMVAPARIASGLLLLGYVVIAVCVLKVMVDVLHHLPAEALKPAKG
jgi:hypothetical protein